MLEMMLDKRILFVLMGVMTVLGGLSKLVANLTLKRMVYAAGNMNKSTHPLMRLVRAKFEHACMISDKVENVEVFVDKYLYEYKVLGMKLHSWRRMEGAAAGMCLLLGIAGAGLEYGVNGMQDMVLKTGAAGAGLAILIFLVHLTTDENYRLEAVRNYMVDYLENICLPRYEKAYQKELKVMVPETPIVEFGVVPDKTVPEESPTRPRPEQEVPSPKTKPEIKPPVMPEPYEMPPIEGKTAEEAGVRLQAAQAETRKADSVRPETKDIQKEVEKEEPLPKDVLIRRILEEFMA